MKIVLTLIYLFFILNLASCASPYQRDGVGGGYSETRLDVNMFRVSFRGNRKTSRQRVTDFTLLRSSELTLKNDFKYFTIIDATKSTKHGSYTSPSSSHTSGYANIYGNSIYGNSTTTTTGGQTRHYSKPSATNTIICFKEKPDNVLTYNAKYIFKSITAKYGIKRIFPY